MQEAPVTTWVIAGGRARRLGGSVKGLWRVGPQTLIERTLGEAPRGPKAINANRPEPYGFLGLPIVGDMEPGRGAPGGLVTALAMSWTEWIFVVACDMPGLPGEAVQQLMAARERDVDVVCFERSGALEPLAALYRRTLWPGWAAALQENPSLRALLASRRCRVLELARPEALDSVNTLEDASRLGVFPPSSDVTILEGSRPSGSFRPQGPW